MLPTSSNDARPASSPVDLAVVDGVERLAVLRANAVGDFVVTLPALAALRRTYPAAALTVIGDTWLAGFLTDRPGPWDEVVVAPLYPGLRGLPSDAGPGADWEDFRARHSAPPYDLILQLHGGGRNSNEFVTALQPRVSAGARASDARELDRWVPYVLGRHESLRCLEIARLVGADLTGLEDLEPRLSVTAGDLAESHQVLGGEVDVVMHTGANDSRRRWPATSFEKLIQRLTGEGRSVTLIGGRADREVAAQISAGAGPGCTDVTGELSLGGTLGLLSRARLFVGNDSGPRHLAAAVGTPTVGIFWIPNLQTFGPIVGDHRAVTAYQVNCPVCARPQVHRPCGHNVSLVEDVAVDDVMDAVYSLATSAFRSRPA